MEELLARFGDSIKTFSRGDKVEGVVIEKRPKSLVLDIGGKSEGIVAEKAFEESKSFIDTLEPGDKVEGTVIVTETPDGFTVVSLRNASQSAAWGALQKAKKEGKGVSATARSVNPAGVVVGVFGLSGFIPGSQLGKEAARRGQDLVDSTFKVAVIELDKGANRIVLSEKAISERAEMELIEKALKKAKKGETLQGKVTTVTDFGCFVEVELPTGAKGRKVALEGLVHVSEMSWGKVNKPADLVKEGDKIKVKVVSTDSEKLALSMKQARKDPWDEAEKKYKTDTKVEGKVVKMSDFGAFVEVEPGIEGLIHITKIPPNRKLKVGDKVNAYVEEVSKSERKISLGLVLTAKPVGYK